jgi:transcription elongation factor Elf1
MDNVNIVDSTQLLKKYSNCPDCGSDKLGNGEGTLNIENEVFERTCKCGWSVTVDKRIKFNSASTKTINGKPTGICELKIHGEKETKHLPVDELKKLAGVRSIKQSSKMEDWLNTSEGRKWAIATPRLSDS